MSQTVTCASCQTVLRVPGGCTDRWLSCPRCLAKVENPVARTASSELTASARRPDKSSRPADADVRMDTGLIGVGLVVLGMLGAIAIFLGTFAFVQGPRAGRKASEVSEVGMFGLGGEIILLLFVVVGIVLTSVSRNIGFKIGGAVAGSLTIAALLVVLFCSGFILVFATCFGN